MKEFKITKDVHDKSVLKTIRIKESKLAELDKIANKNNISLNKLINTCIEFALDNIEENDNENENQSD